MEPIHDGHRQRLKERFLAEGLEHFNDLHVLELLLFYALPRKDTNPIAHALLNRFGTLRGVLEARPEDLREIPGLGESAAVLLTLMPQLLLRYLRDRQDWGQILLTTSDCGRFITPNFFFAKEEQVWLLSLDAKCKVLDLRMVQSGSVNTAGISVRRVVETALRAGASSVVLAHNHPSGIALPSKADEETTIKMWHALNAVGVLLADHVVVAGDDFVSMAEDGFFKQFYQQQPPEEP